MNLKNNLFKKAVFLGIVLLSIYLRLNKVAELYVFGGDEEYQSFYAMTLVKDLHPIWIGVSAANTGFYLGPFWTYLTAILLKISSGDPLITAYFSAFLGVVTTILIFYICLRLFNFKTATWASLINSSLPLIVFFDRKYWNPTLSPLLSILFYYALINIKTKPYWLIIASSLFGLFFHVHLSLIPLGVLLLYVVFKEGKHIPLKVKLYSVISFLIVYSPLIVFDLNHNFSNIKTPFRIMQIMEPQSSRINPIHHIKALGSFFSRFLYLKPYGTVSDEVLFSCNPLSKPGMNNVISDYTSPYFLLTLLLTGIFFLFVFGGGFINNDKKQYLFILLAIIFISFIFFPGGAFEYYLLGSFPLLVMMIAVSINRKSFVGLILKFVITFIVIAGVYSSLTANNPFGLENKHELISSVTEKVEGKRFELFESGYCHKYEGFRYLFQVYGEKPSRSTADNDFGWLYPDDIYPGDLDMKVITHENRTPVFITENNYIKVDRGGFSAYIIPIK